MSEPIPEWIIVWRWYREQFPDDRRPFPQQPHFVDDELLDYASVRELWCGRDARVGGEPVSSEGEREFLAFMREANIACGESKSEQPTTKAVDAAPLDFGALIEEADAMPP